MKFMAIACALLLAACGADGPPRYSDGAPGGVSISGEVQMGVKATL